MAMRSIPAIHRNRRFSPNGRIAPDALLKTVFLVLLLAFSIGASCAITVNTIRIIFYCAALQIDQYRMSAYPMP